MNFIICNENAIYYECGYSNDNAIYLRLGSEAWFFTDSRYEIEATTSIKSARVIIDRDPLGMAVKIIKKSHIRRCKIDPKEWSIYSFERLKSIKRVNWIFEPDFSHKRRIIKNSTEIYNLSNAAKLGAVAFDNIAKEFAKDGFGKDEKSLYFQAETLMRYQGKYEISFEPIVAIDANAAKPHAVPDSSKVLKRGSLLLLDAGLKYNRYCSDRTRTAYVDNKFEFGYNQKFKSKKIQKAYDTVLKAHDKAISKARSGMRAYKIDSIARSIIEKAGFGKYFVHSTGHGVGLDIHEMPYISSRSRTRIEDGMVFTVEPGIYIPNKFGIRIEDTVVMQNGKAVVL